MAENQLTQDAYDRFIKSAAEKVVADFEGEARAFAHTGEVPSDIDDRVNQACNRAAEWADLHEEYADDGEYWLGFENTKDVQHLALILELSENKNNAGFKGFLEQNEYVGSPRKYLAYGALYAMREDIHDQFRKLIDGVIEEEKQALEMADK